MNRERSRRRPSRAAIVLMAAGFFLALEVEGRSDVINFTGNVANDFPASPGTTYIAGTPGSVAESSYIVANGWTSGFLVESLRLSYNQANDTLYVGVQTYSITGDADGNPNPGSPDPQLAAGGGINPLHFGGDKSLTVAFAGVAAGGGVGATEFVAGIPADKSVGDTRNTNEFTVATYKSTDRGLAYSYGTILNNHVGQLAVDPSASAPNFEFSVTNASKIPGFNPANGFYVSLFLGSQQAIVVGKEALNWSPIPAQIQQPGGITANGGPISPPRPFAPSVVPEPGSVVLLLVGTTALLGGARLRRRRSA